MKAILMLCLLLSAGLRSERASVPMEPAAVRKMTQGGKELLAAKDYKSALQLFILAREQQAGYNDKEIWRGTVDALEGAGMAAEALVTLEEFKSKFGESPEISDRQAAIKKAHPEAKAAYEALLVQSKEGATRGNLSAMRSALAIYYADNEGKWPKSFTEAPFLGKYIDQIPREKVTGSRRISTKWDGKGGWVYDSKTGKVQVNVAGKDSQGREYRSYGE